MITISSTVNMINNQFKIIWIKFEFKSSNNRSILAINAGDIPDFQKKEIPPWINFGTLIQGGGFFPSVAFNVSKLHKDIWTWIFLQYLNSAWYSSYNCRLKMQEVFWGTRVRTLYKKNMFMSLFILPLDYYFCFIGKALLVWKGMFWQFSLSWPNAHYNTR